MVRGGTAGTAAAQCTAMLQTIALEDLVTASGGHAGTRCRCALSHADQLKNGNGGIVPKLPPRSHADHLEAGNGGIVPKL